jgi:hypothetical protein
LSPIREKRYFDDSLLGRKSKGNNSFCNGSILQLFNNDTPRNNNNGVINSTYYANKKLE